VFAIHTNVVVNDRTNGMLGRRLVLQLLPDGIIFGFQWVGTKTIIIIVVGESDDGFFQSTLLLNQQSVPSRFDVLGGGFGGWFQFDRTTVVVLRTIDFCPQRNVVGRQR
jgi:hypothetical protein